MIKKRKQNAGKNRLNEMQYDISYNIWDQIMLETDDDERLTDEFLDKIKEKARIRYIESVKFLVYKHIKDSL